MEELQLPGELERGTPIAGYKIRQRVGAGPTGTVYAAVHPINGRKVAVKVIHAHLTADGPSAPFMDAAGRLTDLHHPGIVPLLEVGWRDDRLFLISEFAQGQPLGDLLASSGQLSLTEAQPLLEALALVLASAHGRGLVHGSLTADNIWVAPREEGTWPPMVRVMDFGMGLFPRPATDTPYYLAPEQCRGEPPTTASDIYALGVVAYQMFTGRLPFSSVKPAEVVQMHLEAEPRPPSQLSSSSPAIDSLVLKALSKTPADRFQTMIQVRHELQRLGGASETPSPEAAQRDEPETATEPRAPTVGAVAAVAAVAAEPEAPAQPDTAAQRDSAAEPDTPAEAPGRMDPTPPVIEVVPDSATAPDHLPPPLVEAPDTIPMSSATTSTPPAAQAPPDRAAATGKLPAIGRRSSGPLFSAALGLAVALVLGVGAYRLLAGSWPWASAPPSPGLGRLRVTTTPPGATVYLDNVPQGTTPLTLPRLRRGQTYELFVHLSGYGPWRQTIALGLDEEERPLPLTLVEGPPRWGTLLLSASTKADFFLDTRRVGTQTRQLSLAEVRAGVDHKLRVVAPHHEAVEQTVRVEAGKVQVLQFDLRRSR